MVGWRPSLVGWRPSLLGCFFVLDDFDLYGCVHLAYLGIRLPELVMPSGGGWLCPFCACELLTVHSLHVAYAHG